MEWTAEIHHLSTIAISHPHAAYAAFTHGLMSHWTFLARTIPNISHLFCPLEEAIHQKFLPSLTGQAIFNKQMRKLLSLPVRLGGLGISDPTKWAPLEFEASEKISAPLTALVIAQDSRYDIDNDKLREIKAEIHADRADQLRDQIDVLKKSMGPSVQRAMELATEKGASTWLSVLPIEEYGFTS